MGRLHGVWRSQIFQRAVGDGGSWRVKNIRKRLLYQTLRQLVGMHHGNVKESRVFHWCYDPTIRKQTFRPAIHSIGGFTTVPSSTGEVDEESQAIWGTNRAFQRHVFCNLPRLFYSADPYPLGRKKFS
jgi:hypothetical protein